MPISTDPLLTAILAETAAVLEKQISFMRSRGYADAVIREAYHRILIRDELTATLQ